ncbi:MAG: GNAT family N-acetyltransferase [Bacteroidota bacterium]|nr:GNAT family N-acetyltransferase [Bacteroidota bacterium]
MFIKGENIALRALDLNDAELLYQWENDMELWHLGNTQVPFSKFTLEQYVMNGGQDIYTAKQLRLMIDFTKQDISIGTIDLFDFDPFNQRAGIGIMIRKEFRKQGLAGESLDLLIEYCFDTLKLHQLYCNILEENTESIKLFQSRNFNITGKKKDWVYKNNQWITEFSLQLINPKH